METATIGSTELTAETILKANDSPGPERVDIPEWSGHVYVRVMSGLERDRWETILSKTANQVSSVNVRASLAAFTVCDKSGKRIFADNQAANLGSKSSVALDRIFEVSQRVNCLRDEDIKELEGNLTADPSGKSGTS